MNTLLLKSLLLAFCVNNIWALRRPEAKRERSPFNDDLLTDESKDQGFFEDINFKSFFEDVGLKASPSAPEGVKHRQAATQKQRFIYEPAQKEDYGFVPSDNLFDASESRNRFTIINSNDDFFAQESSPYNDFYGFDSSPFAASQHHRDYLSPYSESRRTDNFEDYGPPKGFFEHDFSADFGGGNSNSKDNKKKAAQETRSEPQYQGEASQSQKDKTKKCETVHKDTMTCEICKDDFGGFSEHCSHSLHSGKDQKYANSRRRSNEDTFNPLNNQGGGGGRGGGQGKPANDQASSIHTRAYQSPGNHGGYPQPQATVQNKDERDDSFGKDHFYDPFAEQSKINPYNFDYLKQIDELIDSGLKGVGQHRKRLVNSLPEKKSQNAETKKDKKDTVKQASNKEIQQDQHQPQYNQATNQQPAPLYQPRYKQLDPVKNFEVLGKMVKQFAKKDRANCKKRVTKKGMTCYVCPNKHGQVDEECMYENSDPKQGVHMMYQEETSY